MEEQVEKILYKNIYEWVAKNFGESEAEDPSWSIKAMAKDLAHGIMKYDIYRAVERDYLREDCKYIAEQNDIKLSDKDTEWVVEEFMNSEAYVDTHAEDWLWFMHRAEEINKEKGEK